MKSKNVLCSLAIAVVLQLGVLAVQGVLALAWASLLEGGTPINPIQKAK